jgi:hypothetical protein
MESRIVRNSGVYNNFEEYIIKVDIRNNIKIVKIKYIKIPIKIEINLIFVNYK